MPLTKVLIYKKGSPEKPNILSIAPTGVAVININGITVHTIFSIKDKGKMYPLNNCQEAALPNILSELRFLIIDGISMVSNALFYQIHQR